MIKQIYSLIETIIRPNHTSACDYKCHLFPIFKNYLNPFKFGISNRIHGFRDRYFTLLEVDLILNVIKLFWYHHARTGILRVPPDTLALELSDTLGDYLENSHRLFLC